MTKKRRVGRIHLLLSRRFFDPNIEITNGSVRANFSDDMQEFFTGRGLVDDAVNARFREFGRMKLFIQARVQQKGGLGNSLATTKIKHPFTDLQSVHVIHAQIA
jgi:hypothetical protein